MNSFAVHVIRGLAVPGTADDTKVKAVSILLLHAAGTQKEVELVASKMNRFLEIHTDCFAASFAANVSGMMLECYSPGSRISGASMYGHRAAPLNSYF